MYDKIIEIILGYFIRSCIYRRYIIKGKVVFKICYVYYDFLGEFISRFMVFIFFGIYNKKEELILIVYVIKIKI